MTQKFPNGTRVESLLIHDNKILVMKRVQNGDEYYVLPGGGWKPPETFEEGVRREVLEETCIEVSVKRLIFDLVVINDSRKVVYLCQYIKGKPKLGDFNEKESMKNDPNDFYQPMWLPIEQISYTKMYTLEFRDWFLKNYQNGQLPEAPQKLKIVSFDFRQD